MQFKSIFFILLTAFFASLTGQEKVKVTTFATKKLITNPVAITFDDKGQLYYVGVIRRRSGSYDIRQFNKWLTYDLALESFEQQQAFFKKMLPLDKNSADVKDYNNDGKKNWTDVNWPYDPFAKVLDTNNDGTADKVINIPNKVETLGTGIAAGVLWHEGHLYILQEPNLFKYSDTNYLLLSEIIESTTGEEFYTVMRRLLKYEELGLDETWFESLEDRPDSILPLVHQYVGAMDVNS